MIRYVTGDATRPKVSGRPVIVAHGCNNIGAWGAGFTAALDRRWPHIETRFRQWAAGTHPDAGPYELGRIDLVTVEPNRLYVANMVTQRGVRTPSNPVPVDYDAIRTCLGHLAVAALLLDADIAAPRFGAGLAGGDWNKIAGIIEDSLGDIPVTVYDLAS